MLNQAKGNLDRDMLSQNMFEPSLEPSSLNSVVEEVCGMLTPESQNRRMEIKPKLLKTDIKVAIDKMRTQQILINLIQNSLKYCENEEGGWIHVSVWS